MTTSNSELATIAWRARDHMYQATQDISSARGILAEASGQMQWRSRAAEQFGRRCEETALAAGAVISRCNIAGDTMLSIGNYLATQ